MITFPEFKKALECIRHFEEEQQKLDAVIRVIAPSSTGVVEFGNQFMEDYINLLSLAVGDKGEWVSWYVFECYFGTNPRAAYIEGREIIVDSPEKLYEVIVG